MMDLPYEEIIKKIIEVSGLSKEEIEKKIENKKHDLAGLVSEEGAASIVANELGVKVLPDSNKLQIKNLIPGMRGIEITGKVTHKFNINEFKSDKVAGGIGKVGSFIIGDETGNIKIVVWHKKTDEMSNFNEGDVLKIVNGYIKENQNGYKEMHIGEKGKIIVNPEGVEVSLEPKYKLKYLENIKPNEFVEVIGTIENVESFRYYEVCPFCGKRTRIDENGEFVCQTHGKIEPSFSYLLNLSIGDGTEKMRIVMFKNQVEKILNKKPEELLEAKGNYELLGDLKRSLIGEIIKFRGRVNENKMFERTEIIVDDIDKNVDPNEELKRLKESQQ